MVINGTVNGDPYFKEQSVMVDKDTDQMSSSMIEKFKDYFMYAMMTRTNEMTENQECSMDADCGNSNLKTFCCVNAVMKKPKTGKWENTHRCMTKGVVDANFNINLGDFNVKMQCVGAGSSYLIATTGIAAASMAAMTLF